MNIRVLIVDDSPLIRTVLRDVLGTARDITVVGEASDGISAIEAVRHLRPDVVTMDVLMPMMDGLDAMRHILSQFATRVIVLANTEGADSSLAMRALEGGAMEVFAKPRGGFSDATADELVAIIRRVATVQVSTPAPQRLLSSHRIAIGPVRASVVGLVGSTGAPHIIHDILSQLPAEFPWPIAVVQHTSPGFTSALASWLGKDCKLEVKVARDGEPLTRGQVVIAPDEIHLCVEVSRRVRLLKQPRVDGHCPSATVLLRSLAQSFRSSVIGIVLTGMGRDGAEGAAAIHQAGGTVVVQDPTTAALASMPAEALRRAPKAFVESSTGLPSLLLRLWRGVT